MLNIGTVSHGTLRTQDLLNSFSEAYEQYCSDEKDYNPFLTLSAKCLADLIDREAADNLGDSIDYVYETLIDRLEALASRHDCYFGNTEGDGSDFGFWPNEGGEA